MRRRCSSAARLPLCTLHSGYALPLVLDCKQLCDSRTMQRGIDYLQRAVPHEQLSTAKVDLTLGGVDFGNVQCAVFVFLANSLNVPILARLGDPHYRFLKVQS